MCVLKKKSSCQLEKGQAGRQDQLRVHCNHPMERCWQAEPNYKDVDEAVGTGKAGLETPVYL